MIDKKITFKDMENGNYYRSIILIKDIRDCSTNMGVPFVKFKIADTKGEVTASMFNTTVEEVMDNGFTKGSIVEASIKYNSPYYNITNMSVCTDMDVSLNDFIPSIPDSVNEIMDDIRIILAKDIDMSIPDNQKLVRVVTEIMTRFEEKIVTFPAGKSNHHAIKGGLLIHCYRMLKAASDLARSYPEFDVALLETGCLLHDIGKIQEFYVDEYGDFEYTEDGILYGHPELGMMIIRNVADELECYCEKIRRLAHIVLSHHGYNSKGGISPCSLEARCVRFLDQMDVMIYKDTMKKENAESRCGESYDYNQLAVN